MDPDRARQLLQRERERIEEALSNLSQDRPQTLADQDQPGEDSSEALFQDEFDSGLAEDLGEQLTALERAESRLAAGTYGLSIESGNAIPDDRLEALPTAERTLEEQKLHGRG
jgi:DnaK suppressor protein